MDVISIVMTAVITGALSSLSTVAALRVHVNYLKESIERHEHSITRAHERIDIIDRRCAVADNHK